MCAHDPTYKSQAKVRLHHPTPKGRTVGYCDPCLSEIVQALNDGGFQTISSCCGHGHRPGTIMLEDGREFLLLPDFDTARGLDHLWTASDGGLVDKSDEAKQRITN